MDVHSSDQWAFLQDLGKLITFAATKGYTLTGDQLKRSPVEAWINALPAKSLLFARTPEGTEVQYFEAVGGLGISNSLHRVKLAIDLNMIKGSALAQTVDDYRELGLYWESLNPLNEWGGRDSWKRPDADHFQRNPA